MMPPRIRGGGKIEILKSLPYTKKFHGIAVTHPVRYYSVGGCGVFPPGYVCDANVIY